MAFREDSYWNRPLYLKEKEPMGRMAKYAHLPNGGLNMMTSADNSTSTRQDSYSGTGGVKPQLSGSRNSAMSDYMPSITHLMKGSEVHYEEIPIPKPSSAFLDMEEAPATVFTLLPVRGTRVQQRLRGESMIRNTNARLPTGKNVSSPEKLKDAVEARQLQSKMDGWMKSCTSNGPDYSFDMSRVGGSDYWKSGDPPPYPISLPEKQREAITISSIAPSFDALFSNTAEQKYKIQQEKEAQQWPDNEQMREWITKRMVPLGPHHLLTTDMVIINEVLTNQWKRYCIAPPPVAAKPLYDFPNTYPHAKISSVPPADSDHVFSTFANNKSFVEGKSIEYDVDRMNMKDDDDELFGGQTMRPEYRTNRQLMPWLEAQALAPSDPTVTSDRNYVPGEVAEALQMKDEELWEDKLKGYSLADRLAHHRRIQKEKKKLPEPRWLNWDEVATGL